VTLPSGASLKSGGMDVNLGISGPVDKLVITGPVNLSNGDLAGFNLKQKLGALSSFAGLGGNSGGGNDTQIQKLSADVHVDPSGTKADNVDLIVPSIGTVTGNAAVSAENKLSGKMMAKLAAGSVAGAMTGALSSFTGGGGSKGGGIPFTLSGTTSTPIFLPDLGGMAKGMAGAGTGAAGNATGAAGAAAGALGGLFGKKKK
jgi:AsmA protein